jgi:hypothetical protein
MALKLITEICHLNKYDPSGEAFKSTIVKFINGLRSSIKDPLINKINSVCGGDKDMFIQVDETDKLSRSKSLAGMKRNSSLAKSNSSNLPQIAQATGSAMKESSSGMLGTVDKDNGKILVLPHAEPLNEEQRKKYEQMINLFGLELITCFLSNSWANR